MRLLVCVRVRVRVRLRLRVRGCVHQSSACNERTPHLRTAIPYTYYSTADISEPSSKKKSPKAKGPAARPPSVVEETDSEKAQTVPPPAPKDKTSKEVDYGSVLEGGDVAWEPPKNQTGDGRTSLNDKFGY